MLSNTATYSNLQQQNFQQALLYEQKKWLREIPLIYYTCHSFEISPCRGTLKHEFIDVKTMNIHQKMVVLIEKTMETYSKAVILSI